MNRKSSRKAMMAFEWIVITTLMVIGLISGLGALRNALNETAEIIPANVCNLSEEITVP